MVAYKLFLLASCFISSFTSPFQPDVFVCGKGKQPEEQSEEKPNSVLLCYYRKKYGYDLLLTGGNISFSELKIRRCRLVKLTPPGKLPSKSPALFRVNAEIDSYFDLEPLISSKYRVLSVPI